MRPGLFDEGDVVGSGRFRIGDRIGQGAMALIYLADDLRDKRSVALKVIGLDLVGRLDREKRFQNEARFSQLVGAHPNIATVYEAGRLEDHDGHPYLAMEYVAGPDLSMVINQHRETGGMPFDQASSVLQGAALALAALHRRGVVHRDVKPANIMLDRSGSVELPKLVDLGLAVHAGKSSPDVTRMTQHDQNPGTVRYMAPEQTRHAAPNPSFDVYALGLTAYEMLSGKAAYEGLSDKEILKLKMDPATAPFSVAGLRPDTPESIVALLDACLSNDPGNRPGAADVAREIGGLRGPMPGVLVLEEPKRSRWGLVSGFAAIAALGIGIGLWFVRDGMSGERLRPVDPVRVGTPAPAPSTGPREAVLPTASGTDDGDVTLTPDVGLPPSPPTKSVADDTPPAKKAPAKAPSPKETKSKPAEVAEVPARDTERCKTIRARAGQSAAQNAWRKVLDDTEDRGCWSGERAKLVRLRTEALAEQGRWRECAQLGRGSRNSLVQKFVAICSSNLERGGGQP